MYIVEKKIKKINIYIFLIYFLFITCFKKKKHTQRTKKNLVEEILTRISKKKVFFSHSQNITDIKKLHR